MCVCVPPCGNCTSMRGFLLASEGWNLKCRFGNKCQPGNEVLTVPLCCEGSSSMKCWCAEVSKRSRSGSSTFFLAVQGCECID